MKSYVYESEAFVGGRPSQVMFLDPEDYMAEGRGWVRGNEPHQPGYVITRVVPGGRFVPGQVISQTHADGRVEVLHPILMEVEVEWEKGVVESKKDEPSPSPVAAKEETKAPEPTSSGHVQPGNPGNLAMEYAGYIVVCNDDTDMPLGRVLATRRVFGDHESALRYAVNSVGSSRSPEVVGLAHQAKIIRVPSDEAKLLEFAPQMLELLHEFERAWGGDGYIGVAVRKCKALTDLITK